MPAGPSSDVTVALFRVLLDGSEIDQVERDFVHEIKITDWLRLPDVCTISVGYPAETDGNAYQSLDDSRFKIGAELEVKLGSTDESTTESLFKGEIVTVEPSFQSGAVNMVIRAYDRSHRMMRSRKQRTFKNKTTSDIVKEICREYGFRIQTDASGAPHDLMVQHNETDWDFVWRLARRKGFEFVVDDKSATLKKPDPYAQKVELRFLDNLTTFRPRISAVQQVDRVNVRGFSLKDKKTVVQSATAPKQVTEAGIKRREVKQKYPGATLEIAGQSFATAGEANDLAQAQLDTLANAYLGAEGACFGNTKVKAGALLNITGVGRNYSGVYRAAKVVHVLRGGGSFETQFSNSAGEHTLLGQAAGGASNGGPVTVDSVMVGVVTNNKDPEQYGRVKVALPALSDQETFWAPVAVPSAGNERGLSMLPQPNEQVLVAFENGDPSYPYVLGSLHNGKDKPGKELAVTDGSFAMKSDHKALIAAKEDINLRTDGGKWVIEVKGGEIKETVNAGQGGGGGYTGAFDGAYGVKAKQAITIESNMTVTIKAPSIAIEAQGSLSLKAPQVSIEGQAMVNISGGLINLG